MRHYISPGSIWISLAVLVLTCILTGLGNLHPVLVPDSKTYLDVDTSSLTAALSQMRTCGYPLFLDTLSNLKWVPIAHLCIFVIANFIFYLGLLRAGYSDWTATWCTIVLLFGRAAIDLVNLIHADCLALSLAIAATGSFLALAGPRPTPISWLGLALFTFMAYQVHPSYLFLIPLWPLATWIIDRFLLRRMASHREIFKRTAGVALLSTLPFIAFCSLRWVLVGHWGLVSFGGYNLVGIAGQFLDQQLASELPSHLQPVAMEILKRRPAVGPATSPSDFLAMEAMFNPTVWDLAVPIAEELTAADPVQVNQMLNQLSSEIVYRRPWLYGHWLLANANHARQELMLLIAFDKGIAILMLAYGILQGLALCLGRSWWERCVRLTSESKEHANEADRFKELQLLFWLAILFAAARICLVILVEPAISRYMIGAMVLIPAAAAVWLPSPFRSRQPQ